MSAVCSSDERRILLDDLVRARSVSRTSSLRSLTRTDEGVDRLRRGDGGDRVRPRLAGGEAVAGARCCRAGRSRASRPPAPRSGASSGCRSKATRPPMRASAPRDPTTVSPSLKPPRRTRATESLPPWLVCRRLHDLGERRACLGDAEPAAGVGEPRRLVAQRLEQPRDAVAALGRADQHRHDLAARAAPSREILEDPVASAARSRRSAPPSARRRGRRGAPAWRSAPPSRAAARRPGARPPRSGRARGRRRRARARGR